jgi:hypothetical protein
MVAISENLIDTNQRRRDYIIEVFVDTSGNDQHDFDKKLRLYFF